MKTRSFATIALTIASAMAGTLAGCSGSNNPSTTNSSANTASSTSGSSTASSVGASVGGSTGASSSSASMAPSDAGIDASLPACPSGLEDKITTCTPTDIQECIKGCGPDLLPDSGQSNLGTKTCTCTTGVYQCADCTYISPLPACYQESATPPECEAGVADESPCSTPCPPSTGNDVCTTVSDAGKAEGCVCITKSSGALEWTCATLPW